MAVIVLLLIYEARREVTWWGEKREREGKKGGRNGLRPCASKRIVSK